MSFPTFIFPTAAALLILGFFAVWTRTLPSYRSEDIHWISEYARRPVSGFAFERHPLSRRDLVPLIIITFIYASVAFSLLGSDEAPQTAYRFEEAGDSVIIDTGEIRNITSVRFYSGITPGWYGIEFSEDGEDWTATEYFEQKYSRLFQWLDASLASPVHCARYIRLWAWNAPLEMNELAVYDESGALTDASAFTFDDSAASSLFDEQELVEAKTYLNSMYFDEIYHARTAMEHIRNIKPYEVSHPPLGKLIISIGIRLFGMVPFGWRFMGTLFGVLMLPLMFIFIKNMFGSTFTASCGTIVFAFDFMHFVQTRIATIDSYGVFFIILTYFFMYRYISSPPDASFKKTALPLFLSGLFFGIGAACKWIVLYGAPGLLALFLIYQIRRYLCAQRTDKQNDFAVCLRKTILLCVLCYLLLPCVIYYLSYIPYGLAAGMTVSGGMLWSGQYIKIILENQAFMLGYHSNVTQYHEFASRWYTWLIDLRPILYYRENISSSLKSTFGAFGSPMLWWGGLLSLIAMLVESIKKRCGKALFILIGYAVFLLPWTVITRPVFIYHYFPCTVFLTLALCHVFNSVTESFGKRGKALCAAYTGLAVVLFIIFYPVLSGIPFSRSYITNVLCWIPGKWPF